MSYTPVSPCQEYDAQGCGNDITTLGLCADESMYLDESWKQPDYSNSSSDSNHSTISSSSDYVPNHTPNLTELNAVPAESDYRITGTNFLLGNQVDAFRWQRKRPETWDHYDVALWIQYQAEVEHLINLHSEAFADVEGTKLCTMTLDQFQEREPRYGFALYVAFTGIQYTTEQYQQAYVHHQPELHNFEGSENMTSIERYINAVSFDKDDKFMSLPHIESFAAKPATVMVPKIEPLEGDEETPPPSPATSEESTTPVRSSRRGRGKGKLWEFVLNLLLNSETNPEIIKWEDRSNGVFRIVRSDKVAGLWGIRKSNPSMTYEKMSRAMRYYYRKNILERIDGRRLVYKFGHTAKGWQLDA